MRQLLFLTILAIALTNLRAQTLSSQGNAFIVDFYKEHHNSTPPFLYIKGINSYEKNQIVQSIQRSDTLKKWKRIGNRIQVVDSLVLTSKEIQFIIRELEKQTDTSLWNEINIPGSLVISRDTITAIFKDRNRNWNYFRSIYGSSLNSFSIPIFFRNNQLCAFYCDKICGGLCGEGVFSIYRREKDHWIRWFIIYEWVS